MGKGILGTLFIVGNFFFGPHFKEQALPSVAHKHIQHNAVHEIYQKDGVRMFMLYAAGKIKPQTIGWINYSESGDEECFQGLSQKELSELSPAQRTLVLNCDFYKKSKLK